MRSRVRAWTEWSPDFCVCSAVSQALTLHRSCDGTESDSQAQSNTEPESLPSLYLHGYRVWELTSLLWNSFCCFSWLHTCQPPVNSLPSPGQSTKSLKLIVSLLFKTIGMKSGSLMCLIRPVGFGPRSFCLLGSRRKTVLSHSGILWMMFFLFKMFPILSTFPDLHGLIPTHPSHPIWEVTCPRSAPDPCVPPASSDVSGQCPAPSLTRQHFSIMLSYWLTLLNVKFCEVSDLVHPFLPNT